MWLFPPEHRLTFFHEGAAAYAKILAVHAGGADVPDGIKPMEFGGSNGTADIAKAVLAAL